VPVLARLSVVSVKETISRPSVLTRKLLRVWTPQVCQLRSSRTHVLIRSVDAPPPEGDDDMPAPSGAAAPAASTGSRYVPPSLRNRGPGERMPGGPGAGPVNRDDLPTLRVTNISEDVEENDLRDLFGSFGRVARVYVGRDRETGIGKGFAFVSFEDREVAKRAMDKLHGRGYDNLILSVQWSRESISSNVNRNSYLTLVQNPVVMAAERLILLHCPAYSLCCNCITMLFCAINSHIFSILVQEIKLPC
jgi:hypothetical protein